MKNSQIPRNIEVEASVRPATFGSVNVLGIPVARTEEKELTEAVRLWLQRGTRGWVCGINAQAINLAYRQDWLKDFYQRALLNCAEGVGVNVGAWMLGFETPPRIVWAYWIHHLLGMMEQDGYSLFLVGGTETVAADAALRLKSKYPRLRITGQHNGYFGTDENDSVVGSIKSSGTDVLLVGMGMPKQEEWINQNFGNLSVKIAFPVGALLDYLAGAKSRCPKWMVDAGLEWLYRLFYEPRRLWKRYVIGIPLFLFRILRERLLSKDRTPTASNAS